VAPFKCLLTHGFAVDGEGRKMSKSVGNVIAPQSISNSLGAEIVRLWVASTDYSGEMSISKTILDRTVEAYRRVRNSLKFLLANTSDFDPRQHLLPTEALVEIDRFAIAECADFVAYCTTAYSRYDFGAAMQKLQTYCTQDLGSFYLDVAKDRLYTTSATSTARRSAQFALHHILQAILRVMAPVLSFTAEEAWQVLTGDPSSSIFFETWTNCLPAVEDKERLQHRWRRILALRADANLELEALRKLGIIGSSLEAGICIAANAEEYEMLAEVGEELRFAFITSAITLLRSDAVVTTVTAFRAVGSKCERCWHLREDTGSEPAYPTLCSRCIANIAGRDANHKYA
jgi:isoleucyl-tRNA synthetase